jgi:hypothetical protein
MAFLDRERILDIVLTDKGRELMSKNQLKFIHFAFSDEGIDYSGSLASLVGSGSFDDFVHRDLSFEADQRANGKESLRNVDLKTFLYTIPAGNSVLPELVISDVRQEIPITRQYLIDHVTLHTRKRNMLKKPLAAIMRASVPKENLEMRVNTFVQDQKQRMSVSSIVKGKNSIGMSLGGNHIILSGERVLDKTTGAVMNMDKFPQFQDKQFNTLELSTIKKEIEVVTGLDKVRINLSLKTANGGFPSKSGFLIEVFNSGSDGVLTRLIRESVKDAANDNDIQEGFESFLQLGIDEE